MYAVMTTGGKQYRVEAGSELVIERISADAGASVTFDRVLLVGDGDAVTVGTPTVDGATVSGTVLGEALGPKLIIFKFKQKATYRRTRGHRQHMMRVRIDEISAGGKKSARATTADESAADVKKAAPKKAAATKKASEPKAESKKAAATKAAPKKAAEAKDSTSDAAKKPAPRRRAPAKKAESKE